MSKEQFKLPDVGEGLTEGEILAWQVKVGDTVVVNQTLVEVETAKAAVELPSPYAGVVVELLAAEGDTVDVGAPIITIETDPSAATEAAPDEPAAALTEDLVPEIPEPSEMSEPGPPRADAVPSGPKRTPVLVGYGVREGSVQRRPRKAGSAPTRPESPAPSRVGGLEAAAGSVETRVIEAPEESVRPVLAKPPVRKLAKDLGVDLRALTPSGPDDTVTRDDVHAAATAGVSDAPSTRPHAAPDRAQRETREPVKGVRKHMADAMVRSAFTAPHVTEWVEVDVTRTVELLDRLRTRRDLRDLRLSPLLIIARALVHAVRQQPLINSTFDADAGEVVVKNYVNLGIAAATPRGLTVPNIKDADAMSLPELAYALDELVRTAKDGKTQPADLGGGTITITNVGVFGVDGGTPIINPGESAILCVGAIKAKPWVHDGQVVPRQVMELTLSFDHRHIDGETGSKVLAEVAALVEEPGLAI
ncbi:MAG: dihydrolipoamide acetyltransferase family protein [Candidatus Nanopelagicales bacterium]